MAGLSLIEIIYWASTIIGGTLFILRLGMMLIIGGLGGGDGGFDTPKTHGGCRQFQAGQKIPHTDIGVQFKGHHAPKTTHLRSCEFMSPV